MSQKNNVNENDVVENTGLGCQIFQLYHQLNLFVLKLDLIFQS